MAAHLSPLAILTLSSAILFAACSTPPPPSPAEPAPTATASTAPPPPPTTAALPAPPPPAKPPPPCPEDMVDVAVACIDRYEAPNVVGQKPLLMASAEDAVAWCAARGKRLCTEDEWLRACGGPEKLPYPYGQTYDEHACNQDKPFRGPRWGTLGKWPAAEAKAEAARLDQSEPSGARPRCVSPEGVFDLTGNAGEWVVKQHAHPEACQNDEQRGHKHVVQGCSWAKCFRAPHEPACAYVNCAHAEGFHSYEFGARCCKDRA